MSIGGVHKNAKNFCPRGSGHVWGRNTARFHALSGQFHGPVSSRTARTAAATKAEKVHSPPATAASTAASTAAITSLVNRMVLLVVAGCFGIFNADRPPCVPPAPKWFSVFPRFHLCLSAITYDRHSKLINCQPSKFLTEKFIIKLINSFNN